MASVHDIIRCLRRREKRRNPNIGYIDKYRKKIEEFLCEIFNLRTSRLFEG